MFQLRMTYMEIVNMIDRQAMKKAPAHQEPAASEEGNGDSAGQRYFDGRAHDWLRLRGLPLHAIRTTGAPGPR